MKGRPLFKMIYVIKVYGTGREDYSTQMSAECKVKYVMFLLLYMSKDDHKVGITHQAVDVNDVQSTLDISKTKFISNC